MFSSFTVPTQFRLGRKRGGEGVEREMKIIDKIKG